MLPVTNAQSFTLECQKIVSDLNKKAKQNGYKGYDFKCDDYYMNLYNVLTGMGLGNHELELNLVSLATGEFI